MAGSGRLPLIGARTARQRGWNVAIVSVTNEPREELAAEAVSYHDISLSEYGRVVAAFTDVGVRDVYVLGKLPKTLIQTETLDDAATNVLSRVRERGDAALIRAFLHDMAQRGLIVHSQLDLLQTLLVQPGFSAGRELSSRERQDVGFGRKVARWLTDAVDVGQTVVVKDGMVLALEAAEGTDATIRRGGHLGGPGVVVVKVGGSRTGAHDLPVVGLTTLEAMVDVRAAVLAFEAEKTLLLDRDEVVSRARQFGIALVAVEGNGET